MKENRQDRRNGRWGAEDSFVTALIFYEQIKKKKKMLLIDLSSTKINAIFQVSIKSLNQKAEPMLNSTVETNLDS